MMEEVVRQIEPAVAISGIVPMRQLCLSAVSSDQGGTRLNYMIRPQIPDDPSSFFDYVFGLSSGDAERPIDGSEGAVLPDAGDGTIGWRMLERNATSEQWNIVITPPPMLGGNTFVQLSIRNIGDVARIAVLDKSDDCEITEI